MSEARNPVGPFLLSMTL